MALLFLPGQTNTRIGKDFIRGDRSFNLNLQTELLSNPKRQFYLNTTFRKLKVTESDLFQSKKKMKHTGKCGVCDE